MTVYVQTPTVTLPYPGLRPFRRDEFEIFFGREEHVAKLAAMLQEHHFVAVVGPSGCGKSSLVTAGLLPELDAGHAVDIEGPWYEATIRPGDRPISRLSEALISSGVLPDESDEDLASRVGFLDATLRRGPLGLFEALTGAEPLSNGNLLIVVDQFEEIFRFRREGSDQEADAFVALLLETVRQADEHQLPIYVMLTMRSDYLGDCNQFSGLPEAISDSQFLTPRPDREQRHAAIDGPAQMFGGEVEPPLVNRLLNDMGDDSDQLPIMQHALMRMWSLKSLSGGKKSVSYEGDEPVPTRIDEPPVVLTTEVYDEVGGWANTLSNHADEAYEGLGDEHLHYVAQMMFRSLTERGPDQHDVRRPVRVREVADIAGVSTEEVKKVASAFRRSDRSFVTPGLADDEDTTGNDLADDNILDISHESLIRQWGRLREWAKNEGDSAATYRRLEDAAQRWKAGKEAHMRSPGLDICLQWRDEEEPTAAWAQRYGTDFELAMQYLEESREAKEKRDAEAEAQRNELAAERARADEQAQTVIRTRRYMAAITLVSMLASGFAVWAFNEADRASNEAERAKQALIDKGIAEKAEAKEKERKEKAEKAKEEATADKARADRLQVQAFLEKRKAEEAEAKATANKARADRLQVQAFLEKRKAEEAKEEAKAEAAKLRELTKTQVETFLRLREVQEELTKTKEELRKANEQLKLAPGAKIQSM